MNRVVRHLPSSEVRTKHVLAVLYGALLVVTVLAVSLEWYWIEAGNTGTEWSDYTYYSSTGFREVLSRATTGTVATTKALLIGSSLISGVGVVATSRDESSAALVLFVVGAAISLCAIVLHFRVFYPATVELIDSLSEFVMFVPPGPGDVHHRTAPKGLLASHLTLSIGLVVLAAAHRIEPLRWLSSIRP